MAARTCRTASMIVIIGAIVLAILHQDWWWWDSDTRVLGFLPTGLAFHVLYSILAASLWAFAVKFAWPQELEEEGTPQ